MSLELEEAKRKVAEFQKQCEEYLVIIVQQKREADEQQKVPDLPRMPHSSRVLWEEASESPSVAALGNTPSTFQFCLAFSFILPTLSPPPPTFPQSKYKTL